MDHDFAKSSKEKTTTNKKIFVALKPKNHFILTLTKTTLHQVIIHVTLHHINKLVLFIIFVV